MVSYSETGKLALPYLPCHLVSPEVIFEETQDNVMFFSNLSPSFLYSFSSAILLGFLALGSASMVTILYVLGASWMSIYKATETTSFRHQGLFVSSPLTFNTNDVFCKYKWETMLEKKSKGSNSWYIRDIILKSEIFPSAWELMTVK